MPPGISASPSISSSATTEQKLVVPPELRELTNHLASTVTVDLLAADSWKYLFDEYDPDGFGEISTDNFSAILRDPKFRSEVEAHKLEVLEARATDGSPTITYQEFVNIMSNKRSQSFKIAVQNRDQKLWSEHEFRIRRKPSSCLHAVAKRVAKEYLTDEHDRKYYADKYTCVPPPIFMIVVTCLEIGFFVYYAVVDAKGPTPCGPVPVDSLFIYDPHKRLQMWRFVFYTFVHAGWIHIIFNVCVQLAVGVPLEMVHGSLRIGTVYLAGVLAGSLGNSCFDSSSYLAGASGGVYALLAAHLANVLLNFSEQQLSVVRLAFIFVLASSDVGFAIWDRYSSEDELPPIGYVAHLTGALAGLTLGLVVLQNFEQRLHTQCVWWAALVVYAALAAGAILWNVFYVKM